MNKLDLTIPQVYYFMFMYSSTCFGRNSRPSSGAQQLQSQPLVLPLECGGSSAVGRGRAGYNRPDHNQQHCYHDAPTVKPEAATAVVEFLMMGVRTPKTR